MPKKLRYDNRKQNRFAAPETRSNSSAETESCPVKEIMLPQIVSIKDFADRSGLPATKIIGELMKNGVLANINETVDFETASIIGDDLGLSILPETLTEKSTQELPKLTLKETKDFVSRAPVVTIMGHVDHGKTTLLDRIREASVASGESGGITQHISAYQVTLSETKNQELKNKTITFIDTPGHAAFSAMRHHGAAITDIIVLIVAANDGVMPQTKEVVAQAQANNVPIIVAINKIDLPDADPMKVKQQLMELGVTPEEWGGKTIEVEISAKTGAGVDSLLEMILLQAELMDLKADPLNKAVGIVIESHMQKGAGSMAIVLIENGMIKVGDPVVIGSSYGRVRILEDFRGMPIKQAGPSTPVRIAGLKSLPDFGDRLIVVDNEKEARENAGKTLQIQTGLKIATSRKISDEEEDQKRGNELNIIIKTDVKGSAEAIRKSLSEIKSEEVSIKIISEGVGSISESDVTLSKATGAKILGFRIFALGAAQRIADKEGIEIKVFDVIYHLIDYVKEQLSLMLAPLVIEDKLGSGTVLAIFRDDKKGFVAGGRVESGKVSVNDEIKFFQNEHEKFRTKILSLRREKSETKEVNSGTEFGFSLSPGANIAVKDTFIVFRTREEKRIIE